MNSVLMAVSIAAVLYMNRWCRCCAAAQCSCLPTGRQYVVTRYMQLVQSGLAVSDAVVSG